LFRIGLISDTHGLLRPEALAFLRGCDAIVHGGDIGHAGILEDLARLAPVSAVRGNNDVGAWARHVEETVSLAWGKVSIYAIHDVAQLAIDPAAAGVRVVMSGHSHKPRIETREGVLYINPGSAGPQRFTLPVTAGELIIDDETMAARVVDLQHASCPTLIAT
jgi:putative phosphoesterase